jgi:hypothetical protein
MMTGSVVITPDKPFWHTNKIVSGRRMSLSKRVQERHKEAV